MVPSSLPRAWLFAAGFALAAPGPSLADSGASGSKGTSAAARLLLQVCIPALARVLPSGQPRQLTVTPQDIERGFVDVTDARIEVLANQRGEKRLVASVIAAFARSG